LWGILNELISLKLQGRAVHMSEEELHRRLVSGSYDGLHSRDFQIDALSFTPSERLDGGRYTRIVPGGVAVIDLSGPMFRHGVDAGSGEVAVSRFAKDLVLTEDDKRVFSRVLLMDTSSLHPPKRLQGL
jgi:hypothetical protein